MYIVGVGGWCGMGGCCASYLFCGTPLDSCILVICYNHNVIFDINCSVKKSTYNASFIFWFTFDKPFTFEKPKSGMKL